MDWRGPSYAEKTLHPSGACLYTEGETNKVKELDKADIARDAKSGHENMLRYLQANMHKGEEAECNA